MRMFHQCFIEFFDKWEEKTAIPQLLTYADGDSRMTQIFVGGMLGDQQEGDKYTTEPCVCHRCQAPRHAYLDMDQTRIIRIIKSIIRIIITPKVSSKYKPYALHLIC